MAEKSDFSIVGRSLTLAVMKLRAIAEYCLQIVLQFTIWANFVHFYHVLLKITS